MVYTQSQSDAIKAHIFKIGYTVNDKGCEVWNSTQRYRVPYYKICLENGKSIHANIRSFMWMDAIGGTLPKDTHASCGTTNCIKLQHIALGRKKNAPVASKPKRVFTEREIAAFLEKIKNGTTQNERGCHIWGAGLLEDKYPYLPYTLNDVTIQNRWRDLHISRFLWTQQNEDYNYNAKTLTKTCSEARCININHFQLVDNKRELDLKQAWELLLAKTTNVGDCLVLKKRGSKGYGMTTIGGVKMGSHRASFIINKYGGKSLPDRDEHGNQLVIRHTCHKQPGCVNPLHLELGTQIQNAYDDRIDAGTLPMGEKSPNSKISEALAQKIKNSLRDVGDPEYLTKKRRAEVFGTTRGIVEGIDHNRSWSHLPNRFGEVRPNVDERLKSMKRQRIGREREWGPSDFDDAAEMIKANIVESDEYKAGTCPPGPCWLWNLSKNGDGYGLTCFKGRGTKSHKLSLEAEHKRFSKPGEVVRHMCAVESCCNPKHLCFGTRKDNAIDIQLTGSSKAFKLDIEKVRLIRASNASSAVLAKSLGVHKDSINNVRNGKTWSHVV